MLNRLLLAPLLFATACVCDPTVHVETTYASPAMADSIELCAREQACTVLCARAFYLDPSEIDSCRILSLDHGGGAQVEVTYTTYTCVGEDWSSDDGGDDWGDGDPIEDDDPCSYGACEPWPEDEEPWPEDEEPWPEDDEPPPDDEEPPPDDDPPMEY